MAIKKVGKVLADGEVTGHAHRLQKTEVLEREDGVREFSVDKGGDTLKHEEHGKVELKEGKYESGKVIEYDHFAEESRQVRD